MRLGTITLTGVDHFVDLRRLQRLSKDFPEAEWGILYGPRAAGREFRYPALFGRDRGFVEELCGLDGVSLALHVCGAGVTELREGSNPALNDLVSKVGRVQLNLRGREHGSERVLSMVSQVGALNPGARVIVQANAANADLAREIGDRPSIQWLWDESGGRGQVSKEWPTVDRWRSMGLTDRDKGFAGGLGPSNLRWELDRIEATLHGSNQEVWTDMESSMRGSDDRFDLDLAEVVLLVAEDWRKEKAADEIAEERIRA